MTAANPTQWPGALCAQADPEAWFPEKGGSTRVAKRICAGCDHRAPCLEYALAHDERWGVWGATSERERRKLAEKRKEQAVGDLVALPIPTARRAAA